MHNAKDKRIIVAYNEKEPATIASPFKFGSKQILAESLPNDVILTPFNRSMSILTSAGRCPVELVSAILSQPIKKTIRHEAKFYQAISLKTAVRNKTDLVDTSGVSRSIGIARHLINIVLVRVTDICKEWHYGKCRIFRAVCPLCLNDSYRLIKQENRYVY